MSNFWLKLNKPIFVIAPMANVTDVAFRAMFAKYGKPDVMWTEFVSADGLCLPGKKMLLRDLEFSDAERPIVAQLFSGHPDKMYEAAKLVQELRFDGLDINMGCPDKAVEKQGAGAGHIRNPDIAIEVIKAAKRGAPNIPISVKTRIGYNKDEIDTWIPKILKEGVAALTVHLRTRKEMSDVDAHWDVMPRIVAIKNEIAPDTILLGNGDVVSIEDGKSKVMQSGCDGAMVGRGIFGNPWFFSGKSLNDISPEERLKVMLEHSREFNTKLGDIKSFSIMKKHFKAYVSGWDGAKELRVKLMECDDLEAVEKVVGEYLQGK
jgi:nifR3 family TIM-barrel protein